MGNRKTQTWAGLAVLVALLWAAPFQLCGDTAKPLARATPKKTSSTAKKKTRSTSQQAAHKSSSSRTGQRRSAHGPATSHPTKAQKAAAERRRRAQLRPSPERIQEIQQALAQAGYLKAEPSGRWDDQTRDAMRRFQTDHGFPVTGLPEAKSLMKLGLGPHPLPSDLDTGSAAAPGAATSNQPPPTSEAQQNPPSSNPQP